jgi:hypothetical protein
MSRVNLTPRHTDWLTVSRNMTLTLTLEGIYEVRRWVVFRCHDATSIIKTGSYIQLLIQRGEFTYTRTTCLLPFFQNKGSMLKQKKPGVFCYCNNMKVGTFLLQPKSLSFHLSVTEEQKRMATDSDSAASSGETSKQGHADTQNTFPLVYLYSFGLYEMRKVAMARKRNGIRCHG